MARPPLPTGSDSNDWAEEALNAIADITATTIREKQLPEAIRVNKTTATADSKLILATRFHESDIPITTVDDIFLEEYVYGTNAEKAARQAGESNPSRNGQPRRSNVRWVAIMVALSLSLFIGALDQTIMATVIPTISAELHAGTSYAWIGGAYLLANAGTANIWGNLSDIWGRKPILLVTVAIFFGSSIICAMAVNMTMLIVGRVLQGVAGGSLIQLVTIIISDLFSVRSRNLYLALLEFTWAVAGAAGPMMGGALTQALSWRWIFWINLPLCGTAFLLLLFFLDVHNPRTKMIEGIKAIDWLGGLSIIGFTLLLLVGLDLGGTTFSWNSLQVICLLVFGCLMLVVFIYSEKKLSKYPLMPLDIFKQPSNVACLLVDLTHGIVFIAGDYYLPLYFQSVKEASPLSSGLMILPILLTEALGGAMCGYIIHHIGRYLEFVWLGVALLTIGTGLYIALNVTSSLGEIIGFQIIAGIGAGFLFSPPLIAIQSDISQDDTAAATATFIFIRNIATSISLVIGGVVFQNSMQLRKPELQAAQLPPDLIEELAGALAVANTMTIRTIKDPLQKLAVKDAFAWSLRNMWILYTSVAACGLVASAFITKHPLSKEHTETTTGIKPNRNRVAIEIPASEPPAVG